MDTAKLLNNHPLTRIAGVFAVGIVAGNAWGMHLSPVLLWGVAVVAWGVAITLPRRCEHLQGVAVMVCAATLGATLVTLQNRSTANGIPVGTTTYRAIVTSEPQQRGKTIRADLAITQVGETALRRPLRVKASILKDTATHRWQQLHPGDGIEAVSVLHKPQNYYADSHFDYVRWLRAQGFVAQTFIVHRNWKKVATSTASLPRFDRMRLKVMRMRATWLARYRMLGLDNEQYAVVAAMTLGDKSRLTRQLKDRYSVSGASHVLALSGLHLGIVYALLTLLSGRSKRWRLLSQTVILVGIWGYVVLVGLPMSAVRSATMLSVCSLCVVAHRRHASVNTLAFAALVMLAVNPMSLWDIGFQMSFMAVLSILVYYRPLYSLLSLQNVAARWLWGLTAVSVAAQVGTAPLVMYYFGRFSCYFLLTNFVAIPCTLAILYGAVCLLPTSLLPPFQQAVGTAVAWVAQVLNDSLAHLSRLPGASIEGIRIGTLQLCLIYIVIVSLTVIAHYALKIRHQRHLDAFYND